MPCPIPSRKSRSSKRKCRRKSPPVPAASPTVRPQSSMMKPSLSSAIFTRRSRQRSESRVSEHWPRRFREELEGLWPITVTLGIGQICRCVEDLPLSCQRAKAALAYKLYRGQGSIIDFEEVQVEPHQIYYDFETVHQVVNRVRTGDGRAQSICSRKFSAPFPPSSRSLQNRSGRSAVFDLRHWGNHSVRAAPTGTSGGAGVELSRRQPFRIWKSG